MALSILHHQPGNGEVMIYEYGKTIITCIPNLKSGFMMRRKKDYYKSFLLRIWRDEIDQVRRVEVTPINKNDERARFSTIDELMIYLLQETDTPPEENTL